MVNEGHVEAVREHRDADSSGQAPGALSRRDFMRLATGGALVGAIGLPLLLQGCAIGVPGAPAASGGASSGSGSAQGPQMPAYVPFQGPKPDLPATADGVPPAYTSFPKNLVKSVPQPPGKGGEVRALVPDHLPPPPPMEQNTAWQALNKELNVTLRMPIVAVPDYPAVFSTTTAGNDLPDMLRVVHTSISVPNLPAFLQGACEDLTPYLSGDAIKEYPNLANFATSSWVSTVYNKRIYTVPTPRDLAGPVLQANGTLLDSLGVKGFADLTELEQFVKDQAIPGKRYGFGSYPGIPTLTYFLEVFGTPNNWRESGGKFTRDIETDEYKAAVAYVRGLWDQGLMHPDSANMQVNQVSNYFYNGTDLFWVLSVGQFPTVYRRAISVDPKFQLRQFAPIQHDGKNGGTSFLSTGSGGLLALKKAPADRIKELLGIVNYLAAPFGSEEYLLVKYGVKDADFTFDDQGNPVVTDQGTTELHTPWWNITGPAPVLFDSVAYIPTQQYAVEKDSIARGVRDPSVGLYSATDTQKGQQLDQDVTDGVNEILYGRSPVSALDQVVANWRSGGGDQIRAEYEQALQAAK